MSGGWRNSDRSARLPPDWGKRRAFVHRRSGWRCEFTLPDGSRCPNYANGGVDHRKRGDDHSYSNLFDACHQHHAAKSSLEGIEAQRMYRAMRKNPPEPHPGRIRRTS